jgi:hypothetical protein
MGSPTARRPTTGVGVAAASKPREATRTVVVSFMLAGIEEGVGNLVCRLGCTPIDECRTTVDAMPSFIYLESRSLCQIYLERNFSVNYEHLPDQ